MELNGWVVEMTFHPQTPTQNKLLLKLKELPSKSTKTASKQWKISKLNGKIYLLLREDKS